jgi:hypothetical protein
MFDHLVNSTWLLPKTNKIFEHNNTENKSTSMKPSIISTTTNVSFCESRTVEQSRV